MILDMLTGRRPDRARSGSASTTSRSTRSALALDAGHWVGMTLYPITKCTPARAADMVEMYGTERILVNSAGDWGHSDPLAVPEFIFEMRRRGHDEATDPHGRLRQPAGVLQPVQAIRPLEKF